MVLNIRKQITISHVWLEIWSPSVISSKGIDGLRQLIISAKTELVLFYCDMGNKILNFVLWWEYKSRQNKKKDKCIY